MYTQFFIKMPSKGNKTIVSRMIKDVQPNYTIKDFFKTVLLPHAKEEVGELVKVSIVLGDQSELMDIDDVNDLVEKIVGFGAKQIIYFVDQQTAAPQAAPAPLSSMLRRESVLELPTCQHKGRPAIEMIFGGLRSMLEQDKLGFVGSTGTQLGAEWMMSLTNVLYNISTFHDNFKARGFPMPKRFAFTKDANNVHSKKNRAPVLTQEVTETVQIAALALDCTRFDVLVACSSAAC